MALLELADVIELAQVFDADGDVGHRNRMRVNEDSGLPCDAIQAWLALLKDRRFVLKDDPILSFDLVNQTLHLFLPYKICSPQRAQDSGQIPVFDPLAFAPILNLRFIRHDRISARLGDCQGLSLTCVKGSGQNILLKYLASYGHHQINLPLLDKFDNSLEGDIALVHSGVEFFIDGRHHPQAIIGEQPEQEQRLVDLGKCGEDIRVSENHAAPADGAAPIGAPGLLPGHTSPRARSRDQPGAFQIPNA